MRSLSFDTYRNLLIRYNDKLAAVYAPTMAKAVNRVIELTNEHAEVFSDELALSGIIGGVAALMEGKMLNNSDAGRLLCMMKVLERDEVAAVPIFAVTTLGMITSWYGELDDNGTFIINKDGVKAFRSLFKQWGVFGRTSVFSSKMEKEMTQDLPGLFKVYIADIISELGKAAPDMDIRYSSMDSDRLKLRSERLVDDIKFVVDCPSIAVPYYDHYMDHISEKIGEYQGILKKSKELAPEDQDVLDTLQAYLDLYTGFRDIATRYDTGVLKSPEEVVEEIYRLEDKLFDTEEQE